MIALVTGRPQRAFAPQHPKTQSPLRPVVGRLDAMLSEKDPQRVHLTQQATSEAPRLIGACMILVNQLAEPSIPRPPHPPPVGGAVAI